MVPEKRARGRPRKRHSLGEEVCAALYAERVETFWQAKFKAAQKDGNTLRQAKASATSATAAAFYCSDTSVRTRRRYYASRVKAIQDAALKAAIDLAPRVAKLNAKVSAVRKIITKDEWEAIQDIDLPVVERLIDRLLKAAELEQENVTLRRDNGKLRAQNMVYTDFQSNSQKGNSR